MNGCFWHGHDDCKYYVIPKTRTVEWTAKINKNKEKDIDNNCILTQKGWRTITIFECELKGNKRIQTLNELITYIH